MNKKKKSDQDLLHLGLPPMELAESRENVPETNNAGLKKFIYPVLPKIITILILVLVTFGSYITLLMALQNFDVSHNTEIILITGVHDKPNITIGQDNVEIVVELLNNDTYHMPKREKRHAADTLRENENPIAESINDQKIQKAREIIMNHDILCNHENKDKICKEIVNKLKSITEHDEDTQSKQHDENAAKDNLESTNKIKHNHGIYVTSTDKVKRETNPVKDMVRSTSNVQFEGRDSDFYPQENAAHLEPYPPHVHSPISDTCLLARLLKQSYPNLQGVYDSPSSGYLSPPYDSQPLPYSGYAPPVVPAPYNIHSREAEGKRKIHQQDAEIFMKYLQEAQNRPLQPVCNATERGAACAREASCPAGTVSCNDGQGCISEKQWCDGNVDCSDVSDEAVCSCKSRVDVSRICDGYFDCPFGEDEMGCFGCGDSAFSCGDVNINSQSTCFTKDQRCNNIAECPNQRDEMECTMLAPTLHKKPLFAVSNTEGFLHRNFKGDWYPVCKNPYMWAHDACRREAGLIIRSPFMQMVPNDPMSKVTYLNIGSGGLIHTSTTCFNSSAIYVTCPDLVCGTRVPTTSQLLRENAAAENNLFGRNKRFLVRNRPYPLTFYHRRFRRHTLNVTDIIKNSIAAPLNDNEQSKLHVNRNKRTESRVVGGNPSKPTAWPWIIAMYRDGMFHCGGVILTQSWIISAAHCVYKFWEHYFEIQVGMLRRFSFSPQEQNHRVTHVIVNQRYNKIDMVNDLSLLRVTPAIIFSRWVRPICLPTPDTAGPDWLWGPPPGTLCTAVGWGATIEHGPDPDNLREVEVPVWDRCNHVEDQAGKVICAGLPEGGKDACQGDSGGPLLCRNPLNSQQWYMAGIVSHGDGCARKGEPGVYTRVSIFDKWIREHISARTLPTIQPKQECPGFKCMSGISKCIPNKRRCDKIVDCLDAEDERNCNFMRSTPTFGNTELFSTTLFEKDSTDNPQHNTKEAEIGQLINKSEIHTSNTQTTANDHLHDVEHHKTKVDEIVTSNDDTLTTHFEKTNPTDTTITATNPETVTEVVITHITDHTILHGSYMSEPTTSDLNVLNSTEINFWDASPLEMVNGRSSEVSSTVNHSDNVTVNPNGPTISEEMESTNRGDMNTFTMVSSRQPLESSSALKEDKKSRGADIIEDWTDSDTTDSTVTIKENKHISDTVPDSQNHEDQDLELTHTNDENFHLTTIGNDNTELESKGLLLDLTQSSSSLHENNLQNIDHEEALHTSNPNLKTSPAKKLPDLEEKTGIVNKIKDIVLSKLQPAKIRNKHRIPNEFECRRIYQSVPYHKRCDHKADCEDGTDELGCTCTDFLYTFDRKLICDGIFDCADGRDEIDCYNCPEDQFLCKRSQLCLPSNHVCDGKPQCPQGEDELDCFALSNGKNLAYDIDGRPKISLEGYLTKKHTKDWHIVCEDNLSTDQQEQASEHICRYLGFSSANRYIVKHINIKEDDILKKRVEDQRSRRHINEVPIHFAYRQVDEDTARHIVIDKPQVLKEQCVPNVTKTCMSLYVFCDHSLYSEYGVGQELFYNREAEDMTHMWPWVAKIYAEGKYKCTGVLVDLSWVLVSHSCLWDSLLSHHVTVVLGSHRTLSLSDGMYEQVYQVDAKKDFYNSKVALLHLKEPAHYSSMVKPMALMSSSNLQDTKSTICVAVGQNENNSTVGVFLRETNAKCDLNSRCYERLRQHENICSPGTTINRPWAGIVSCHTDRGWYPAASFVEKGGECGLGNHIHGSEIGYLKNEMKNFVGRSASNSSEYSDACEGQRCGRGNCVPLTQVCDGVSNCHDGKDESQTACDDKRQICTQNAYHKGCECSTGQLKCHNGNCVAKELFGDGRDDCGDGTDEPKYMTCSAYISRVKPSRLCDGILHCQDRSDEDPMYCKCFAKATYKCRSTHDDADHCVAPDMVCDGVKDCPNGDDEHACMGLSAPEGSTYGTGQVMVRSHGVWYSKCYPTQNHTRDELEGICREVGFISGHAKQLNPPVNNHFHPYNNLILDPFSDVALNNNTKLKIRNTNEPIAKAIVDNTLENCYPVYIECL